MQTAAAWRVLTVTTEHQCVEQTAADLPQLDPELPSVLIALTWSDKSVGNFVEQDFAHKRRVVGVAHVNPDQFFLIVSATVASGDIVFVTHVIFFVDGTDPPIR
jgi:hypothetical protein